MRKELFDSIFGNNIILQNEGKKYSDMLMQLINAFESELNNDDDIQDMFGFAIEVWNAANVKMLIPNDKKGFAKLLNKLSPKQIKFAEKMVDYKIKHFKEYTNFILDYEIEEVEGVDVLSVVTISKEQFIAHMLESRGEEDVYTKDDHDDNFINRIAIVVRPLQPLQDWFVNLYSEEEDFEPEVNIYLISDDKDPEAWLGKKFDKIFTEELSIYHSNKKEWPQKRNYKMFNEWFQVDIVYNTYDFEKKPVLKSL